MARSWTKAQHDAIYARGGPLLVSAAAGSGKTSVLVERVITLICDSQNPVEADRLLIVTYTKAAAAEMTQRINARLSELIRENPGDMRLVRQQALLAGASIGTIHSFCLGLIKENFQHLPVGQDFQPADESEMSIMREECAKEAIERFYARNDDSFSALVELLSAGRDDRELTATLLRLYDFARSHPFYEEWMDQAVALYGAGHSVEETRWGKALLEYSIDTLDYCIASMEDISRLIEGEEAAEKAYGEAIRSDIDMLLKCRSALDGDWDEAVACFTSSGFGRLKPLKGNEELKARVKAVRERCKKLVLDISAKTLNATREDFASDMADLAPKVGTLFELTRLFSELYADRKRLKKRMDFSDLEHFALSLLVCPDRTRTERAEAISSRFDAVLVDEFQDVSEVQDLIFSNVSNLQRNLFMVGDAKQSIYSFRLATPEIFMERKRGSFPYDGTGQYPAKIILDTNFRSRAEVVDGVNFLFELLMGPRVGEIDYSGEELLRRGAGYPDHPGAAPEFLLLEEGGYEGEEDSSQLEAAMVAGKIARMLEEGYPVTEKGGVELRPCRPGDFCVLLRSPRRRMGAYVSALEKEGLPVSAQSADGFLALREVEMILSLLRALDNPLRDLSLAGALMSPLFDFSDADVAYIRLSGMDMPLYRALLRTAEGQCDDPGLADKCRGFLSLFLRLRRRAAVLPAASLLLEIYACTDALAVIQAMPLGEIRRQNLLLLVEYADDYHNRGYKQLGGFVGFLDRLSERGGDLLPAGIVGEGQNAVRVMSVHRSKGLEFPIVILAATAGRFNLMDTRGNAQLHSSFGFACARRDPETMKQYSTIPMQAIRLESKRSTLSEELRILYVALTRAREKLIVTACHGGSLRKKVSGLAEGISGGRLGARAVEEAGSMADWIIMALLHHPDGTILREMGSCLGLETIEHPAGWIIRIIAPEESAEKKGCVAGISRTAKPDPALQKLLKERANWVYPHAPLTKIPVKLAVSAVTRGEGAAIYRFASRPRFTSGRAMTAAERGNAMHKFMQFSSYERASKDLNAEINLMTERLFLTQAEADSLHRGRLRAFFKGKLAARIFASKHVWRELRFLKECGSDILGKTIEGMDEDSRVALQGVADCVFVEDGKAFIVDYKTDRVNTPDELLDRYAGQLRLYRLILSDALQYPIGGCIIYSFELGSEIEVR